MRGAGGLLDFLTDFRTTPTLVGKEVFDVDLRLVVINDQSKKDEDLNITLFSID